MANQGEDSIAPVPCRERLLLVAAVRQRQGRIEEARAFLERASELHSQAEHLERAEQGVQDAPEEP